MNKETAQELYEMATWIEVNYSNPDRKYNYNSEKFTCEGIRPLSEYTAAITYKKSSGKKALVFAFYKKNTGWDYFFPRESHIYGMLKLAPLLQEVEEHNYQYNNEPFSADQLVDNIDWQSKKWEKAIKK